MFAYENDLCYKSMVREKPIERESIMARLDDEIWARKLSADRIAKLKQAEEQSRRREELKAEIEKARRKAHKALIKAKYPSVRTLLKITYLGEERAAWYVRSSIDAWDVYITSTGELVRAIPNSWVREAPCPYDAPYVRNGDAVELDNSYYRQVLDHLRMFPDNLRAWVLSDNG